MPSDPDYAIYAEQLFSLNHGHALFEPDSASQGYDQVRVGDVGYIEYGAFRRLFNICFDSDHPINEKIPEDFVPLAEEYRKIWTRHPLEAGIWSSSTVRELGGGLGLSEPIVINAGAAIKLLCAGQRGAALAIKDCADRYDADSKLAFQRCMKEQYESWHAFARNVLCRDVKVRDIVLVTGCDLASDWVTMTFDKMEIGAKVSFEVGQFPIGSGEFALWGRWGASTSIPQRWGPKPSSTVKQSKLLEGSSDQPSVLPDSQNQCIFIRGYRVFHRAWFLPRLIAAAEPKDLDGGLPPSASSGSLSGPTTPQKYTIEELGQEMRSKSPAGTLRRDLYDILAEFVFETSAVDMVLIHDDNVCTASSAAPDGGLSFSTALLSSLFDVERAECSSESVNIGVLRNKPSSSSPSEYLSPAISERKLLHPGVEGYAASNSSGATKSSPGRESEYIALQNKYAQRKLEIRDLQARNASLTFHNEQLLRQNQGLLREIEQLRWQCYYTQGPSFQQVGYPLVGGRGPPSDIPRGRAPPPGPHGLITPPSSNNSSPAYAPLPAPSIVPRHSQGPSRNPEGATQNIFIPPPPAWVNPTPFSHPQQAFPGYAVSITLSGNYPSPASFLHSGSGNQSSEEQKGAGPSARK